MGHARVIVYGKKSLKYEQVVALQDLDVQSVWLKGWFNGSQKMYYCHFYREHTNTMGNSMAAQRRALSIFLNQWESAVSHQNQDDDNECHIFGDINMDCHLDRWLESKYSLHALSKLVLHACNLSNYTQLVSLPTRSQYNRVKNVTSVSCIDHLYCNFKNR